MGWEESFYNLQQIWLCLRSMLCTKLTRGKVRSFGTQEYFETLDLRS